MTDEPNTPDTLLTFPCEFHIKILGRATASFFTEVKRIVRDFYPDIEEDAFKTRHSAKANYVGLTVVLHPNSKDELDALYQALTASEHTVMVL